MVLTLLPFVVLLAVAAAATVTAAGGSGPSVVPLPQCREARAGSVSLDAASTTIASDDAFATAWLTDALATACAGGDGAQQPAQRVELRLPGAELSKALQARSLALGPGLGADGYLLDIRPGTPILIAAQNRSGLFHGVQTLLQSLRAPTMASSLSGSRASTPTAAGCELDAATVEDWPDAQMRGVYWQGSWFDAFPANASFMNHTINEMAKYKHNFAMFNGNGAALLFDAAQDPGSPRAGSIVQYYKHWQSELHARHIEMIPQISAANSGAKNDLFEPFLC
jgi:hypothetical protein